MEHEYITLYCPLRADHTRVDIYGHQLSAEITKWLKEHVGSPPPTNRDWYLNLDNDKYQWYHFGLTHDEYGKAVRAFLFRNTKQAMLFKLTWM